MYGFDYMEKQLRLCTEDMKHMQEHSVYDLDVQTRAYDLLDVLLAMEPLSSSEVPDGFSQAASSYCDVFENVADLLDRLYDEQALKNEAKERLVGHETALNEARFEAASAASLHEFAKEVFEIWQTGGIFSRRRALKQLRDRAGFRLESHRIGNYVAKTFDLMNEAQARFAKAQQALFAADMSYKITPALHSRIHDLLVRVRP